MTSSGITSFPFPERKRLLILISFYSSQSIWGAPSDFLESPPQSYEALLRTGSTGPSQMQEVGPSEQRGHGLARKVQGL